MSAKAHGLSGGAVTHSEATQLRMCGQAGDETVDELAVHMNHLTGREGVGVAGGTTVGRLFMTGGINKRPGRSYGLPLFCYAQLRG
ncbi:MAG: hypothetical protein FH756_00580 [Firmicutes bacterium]|nr:hypothetical protein [Bacillota bacterium]